MDGKDQTVPVASSSSGPSANDEVPSTSASSDVESGNSSYTLAQLAYTRSGDKADTCNIGKSSNPWCR